MVLWFFLGSCSGVSGQLLGSCYGVADVFVVWFL